MNQKTLGGRVATAARCPLIPLFRDPSLQTKVSSVDAPGRSPILKVEDLPEHRIEVHVFDHHDKAIAFEAAVLLIGGNAVACHREATARRGNIVVLAYLAEDRPAVRDLTEAVMAWSYKPSGEDARRIATHLDERNKGLEAEFEARKARVEPVMAILRERGAAPTYDGNTSCAVNLTLQAKDAEGWPALCQVQPKGDLWAVVSFLSDNDGIFWEKHLDPRLQAAADAAGLSLDRVEHEMVASAVSLVDLPAVLARFEHAWSAMSQAILVIRCERLATRKAAKRQQRNDKAKQRRRPVAS